MKNLSSLFMVFILSINCSQPNKEEPQTINLENIIWNPGDSSDNDDGSGPPSIINMCAFTKENNSLAVVQIEHSYHQPRGLCPNTDHYLTSSTIYKLKILQAIGGPELPFSIEAVDLENRATGRFRFQPNDFALVRILKYKNEYLINNSIKIEETYQADEDNKYIVDLPITVEGLISGYHETLNNIDECPEEYQFTIEEWENYIYGNVSDCPSPSEPEENNSNFEGSCSDDPESENACP